MHACLRAWRGRSTSSFWTADSHWSGDLERFGQLHHGDHQSLSAGFDLQEKFEVAVDTKLTDAVRGAARESASVSLSAGASAYFPMDIFDFADVEIALKAQAEANVGDDHRGPRRELSATTACVMKGPSVNCSGLTALAGSIGGVGHAQNRTVCD